MSALGVYIKDKRIEQGLSRLALAEKASISHTEIKRIEDGVRQQPSYQVISRLADALLVSRDELLKVAGYEIGNDNPTISTIYPGLHTDKQIEVANKIISGLSRNSDLKDEDLDDLYRQVEMFLAYKGKK